MVISMMSNNRKKYTYYLKMSIFLFLFIFSVSCKSRISCITELEKSFSVDNAYLDSIYLLVNRIYIAENFDKKDFTEVFFTNRKEKENSSDRTLTLFTPELYSWVQSKVDTGRFEIIIRLPNEKYNCDGHDLFLIYKTEMPNFDSQGAASWLKIKESWYILIDWF